MSKFIRQCSFENSFEISLKFDLAKKVHSFSPKSTEMFLNLSKFVLISFA